jgi:hypothetical protein
MYALQAVYTITMAKGFPIFIFSEFLPAVDALSPLVIIGDYNGFIIQQYTLHSAIGTGNNAYLFPEPGKYPVKYQGKD